MKKALKIQLPMLLQKSLKVLHYSNSNCGRSVPVIVGNNNSRNYSNHSIDIISSNRTNFWKKPLLYTKTVTHFAFFKHTSSKKNKTKNQSPEFFPTPSAFPSLNFLLQFPYDSLVLLTPPLHPLVLSLPWHNSTLWPLSSSPILSSSLSPFFTFKQRHYATSLEILQELNRLRERLYHYQKNSAEES